MMKNTKEEIDALRLSIEEEFGKDVLYYVEGDLTLEERYGLWAFAKILLITTLRDGQCLPPLEFIAIKTFLK